MGNMFRLIRETHVTYDEEDLLEVLWYNKGIIIMLG